MTQLELEFERSPGARPTAEQALAIDRRDGNLLLDAGAGSGKTTVLVERFARSVLDDGIDVARILAITFTDKAAAELRERVRRRLRELGDPDAARATEGAWISTIHGFCARLVRAHALDLGLDPEFTVLEPVQAAELASSAFDGALVELAGSPAGADLIATLGVPRLRAAITGTYEELRSGGAPQPSLPACPQAAGGGIAEIEAVRAAATAVLGELGQLAEPGARVREAIELLERVDAVLAGGVPWPGELDALKLAGAANALRTDACDRFRDAVGALRALAEPLHAGVVRDALEELLRGFGQRYGALKHERSGLDFEDLELLGRLLLARPEVRGRCRERFQRVMVDEMQDTNRVQLELIDLVADGNLFMVGDAQQSIYAFRHADVELFEQRGRELAARGARLSLRTSFRARPQILAVLNRAFAHELGESFRPLLPGRADVPHPEPAVELLVVDRLGDYEDEGTVAPWRQAEARALAARVRRLIEQGEFRPGEIVVLTRATTDLAAYERALEDAGVPTYVIGGRGYWSHPQVTELVCHLRALANPLDQEAWFGTLLSPWCGLSLDGLVLVAAGAREELQEGDAERLGAFEAWFAAERAGAAWIGPEGLLERALAREGYWERLAALPDARRRVANVRKLLRLARDWEAAHGSDLHGFVALLGMRRDGAGSRESEAPVASEALDAVRLMTIHRSKGLEFPVVCVADLGRQSGARGFAPIVRVGRDGRLGLRIGRPGTAGLVNVLAYDELRSLQVAAEAAEERRLFYVAMTRAQERLILSGAAQLYDWETQNRRAPIGWIGSALVPEIGSRLAEGRFTTGDGVDVTVLSEAPAPVSGAPGPLSGAPDAVSAGSTLAGPPSAAERAPDPPPEPRAAAVPPPPQPRLRSLSYTALADYHRCGYRFYVERVLGLPGDREQAAGAELGSLVHELLRDLDLRRPPAPHTAAPDSATPDPAAPDSATAALVDAFLTSDTAARLARAQDLRREQPFSFLFGGELLVTGVFDALALEPASGPGGRLLVVDYKTDRLTIDPDRLAAERYGDQRTIYALAALRTGWADAVEVVHLFLEAPERPVASHHTRADIDALESTLAARVAGLGAGDFPVAAIPGRSICAGCPAAGGLCSYPPELTSR